MVIRNVPVIENAVFVPTSAIIDPRLSLECKGLFVLICSLADTEHQLRSDNLLPLLQDAPGGADDWDLAKLSLCLSELASKGYIELLDC